MVWIKQNFDFVKQNFPENFFIYLPPSFHRERACQLRHSGSKVKFVRLGSFTFGLVQWRWVSGNGQFVEWTGDSRGQSWKSDYLWGLRCTRGHLRARLDYKMNIQWYGVPTRQLLYIELPISYICLFEEKKMYWHTFLYFVTSNPEIPENIFLNNNLRIRCTLSLYIFMYLIDHF